MQVVFEMKARPDASVVILCPELGSSSPLSLLRIPVMKSSCQEDFPGKEGAARSISLLAWLQTIQLHSFHIT